MVTSVAAKYVTLCHVFRYILENMRADRLVSLVLLLRRRGRLSATELADELEVSVRTVLRDIEALSIAGVPVYAERGRHGGFELLPGFRTELTGLTQEESLALLATGSRRGVQVFGLGSALAAAMLKVFDALPEETRDIAAAASERLLIDPEKDLLSRRISSEEIPDSILTTVRQAVLSGHKLRIHYQAIDQDAKWRTVDPIGLVVVREQTYLIATKSGEDRTYRLSRIAATEELVEPAERSERVDLEQIWQERSAGFLAHGGRVTVSFRVEPEQRDTVARSAVALLSDEAGTDGWRDLRATFLDARQAEEVLWHLGADAVVLEPQWLRVTLHDRAVAVAAHYNSES